MPIHLFVFIIVTIFSLCSAYAVGSTAEELKREQRQIGSGSAESDSEMESTDSLE